jgi:hypothetical protein
MVSTATPSLSVEPAPYAGIATRGIALGIDAAVANGIVLLIAALVSLVSSLVGDLRPQWLVAILAVRAGRWPSACTSRCSGPPPARRRGCG